MHFLTHAFPDVLMTDGSSNYSFAFRGQMSAVGVIRNERRLLPLKGCGAATVILKNANQRWAEGLRDWLMTSPSTDWLIKRGTLSYYKHIA